MGGGGDFPSGRGGGRRGVIPPPVKSLPFGFGGGGGAPKMVTPHPCADTSDYIRGTIAIVRKGDDGECTDERCSDGNKRVDNSNGADNNIDCAGDSGGGDKDDSDWADDRGEVPSGENPHPKWGSYPLLNA